DRAKNAGPLVGGGCHWMLVWYDDALRSGEDTQALMEVLEDVKIEVAQTPSSEATHVDWSHSSQPHTPAVNIARNSSSNRALDLDRSRCVARPSRMARASNEIKIIHD